MPHLKSLWPNPPAVPPHLNMFETIMGQPHHDKWPDYVLHIDEETGQTRTYREFRKRVNDLAAVLGGPVDKGGLGLRAEDGEVVGLMSDNSSDFMVVMLALLKIAVPFALISPLSTPFELTHALKVARPTRLFIASHLITPKVLHVVQGFGIAKTKVYIMEGSFEGHESLDGLIQKAGDPGLPHTGARIVPKDTLAVLFFSSGTTGLPKAVIVSHGNLLFAHHQVIIVAKERASLMPPPAPSTPNRLPVILAILPMYHTFGLHIYCFRAFIFPTQYVIFRRWNASKLIEAIPKYRPSSLLMVASMWYQLVNHPNFSKTDFSSVVAPQNGAAYLPREIMSQFLKMTPKSQFFTDGFGISEATVTAIIRPYPGTLNGYAKDIPESTGFILPGMEARIVREDGSEADFDEVGELWLKGENVVSGYFHNPQATRDAFVDGWLRTGDHFRVNKEQYFFFADRVKDTLKVSGSQVSPLEIEGVLMAHPQKLVADATVAGVSGAGRTPDEKVPRAWIVLSESGKEMGTRRVIEELEKWHQTHLSKYKWLRGGIEVVEEIPKSYTGKMLRRVLQDQYEERTVAKPKL